MAAAVLLSLLLIGFNQPSKGNQFGGREQGAYNGAVIWRGFEEQWGYNHRLNRMGDFVKFSDQNASEFNADVTHAAASGSGSDTATFRSYFTEISSPDVGFQSGSTNFEVTGKEDETISMAIPVSVPAEMAVKNRGIYQVILNGFDMCAKSDAKKPVFFHLGVGDVKYDNTTNKINLQVFLNLRVDCKSVECKPLDKNVDYNMTVNYLVLAGDNGKFASTSGAFDTAYSWDDKHEIFFKPKQESIAGVGGAFPFAALGLSAIQVDLHGTDQWMVEWNSAVRPAEYNPQTGKQNFDLDLFFKQWNALTSLKLVSFTKPGAADWSANVVLFQFKDARIVHKENVDSIPWDATGGGSCVEAATKTSHITFNK